MKYYSSQKQSGGQNIHSALSLSLQMYMHFFNVSRNSKFGLLHSSPLEVVTFFDFI